MTRNPVIVKPLTTIEDCAKKMIKEHVGSLIIKENDRLKGILTEKDIVEKVVARGLNTKKVTVNKIMTVSPVTINPEKDIMDAVKFMNEKQIRRLPVVKDNKLLGLITVYDILKIQPELLDLISEKSKVNAFRLNSNEEECQVCGNFTLVTKKKNQFLCNECFHKR